MAEELQSLLERIHKDGIDKTQVDCDKIIATAKKKAAAIISEAKKEAEKIISTAKQDGASFTENGKKALEQSARDIVLFVGEAINRAFTQIAMSEVSSTLSKDGLSTIIGKAVEAYCSGDESDIIILLNDDDKAYIKDFLMSKFSEQMKNGLNIQTDNSIVSGFKVSVVEKNVEHTFTGKAITDSLSKLLRRHVAEVLKKAMNKEE